MSTKGQSVYGVRRQRQCVTWLTLLAFSLRCFRSVSKGNKYLVYHCYSSVSAASPLSPGNQNSLCVLITSPVPRYLSRLMGINISDLVDTAFFNSSAAPSNPQVSLSLRRRMFFAAAKLEQKFRCFCHYICRLYCYRHYFSLPIAFVLSLLIGAMR